MHKPLPTPPQLVHAAHGLPAVDGCSAATGRCYVCVGTVTRGKTVRDWLSSNFTDQTRARCPSATHVCEACCYVMSRIAPVLARPPKVDKKYGGSFRNYSHLCSEGWSCPPYAPVLDSAGAIAYYDGQPGGEYCNASKGEKPLIREFLERRHTGLWFAAIADSGQKHVLPFAPMNMGPSGTVLFEDRLVELPGSLELIDACTEMLSGGVNKDELLSGDYRSQTWREMTAEVRAFESEHAHQRGGVWMDLAVWLAQRDVAIHAETTAERAKHKHKHKKETKNARPREAKKARNSGDRVRARGAKRVHVEPERQPANELLGAVRGTDAGDGAPDNNSKRVGVHSDAQAAGGGPTQQRLPGFD